MAEGGLPRGIVPLPDRSGAWVLLDKPAGMTSRDVVNQVTRITGVKKSGHAGTLDPLATGLLVVGVGRGATKRLGEGLAGGKTYLATAQLGLASPTLDTDSDQSLHVQVPEFPYPQVREALERVGRRPVQEPPLVSALKVRGQALHKIARRGWWLPRDARLAEISELAVDRWDADHRELTFSVSGGGGLYVRAIVRDLGAELGVPAALTALRRIKAGPYDIDQAIVLEDLSQRWLESGLGRY